MTNKFWGAALIVATLIIVLNFWGNRDNTPQSPSQNSARDLAKPVRVKYSCPETSMAGYSFSGDKQIPIQKILDSYGLGCHSGNIGDHSSRYLFFLPKSSQTVEFEAQFGYLSGIKFVRGYPEGEKCLPKKEINSLRTGKGLRLGDSKAEVVKLYGEPYATGDLPEEPNLKFMLYSDVLISGANPPEALPPGHTLEVDLEGDKVSKIIYYAGE